MAPTPDPAALGALKLELAGNVTLTVDSISFAAVGIFLETVAAERLAVVRTDGGQVVAVAAGTLIAAEWEPA